MTVGPIQIETRPVVSVDKVNHYYGEGDSRNQVLFNNCLEIGAGQLVTMTGPSGSGKTSLTSLIGGLRSVQDGTIHILDRSPSPNPQTGNAQQRRRHKALMRHTAMRCFPSTTGSGQAVDAPRSPAECLS